MNDSNRTEPTVSVDEFLFACFEYERTEQALHGRGGAWKGRFYGSPRRGEATSLSFRPQLDACLVWYAQEHPYLVCEDELTLDNLHLITKAAVLLGYDIAEAYAMQFKSDLPAFRQDDESWGYILTKLKTATPTFAPFITRFLEWAHNPDAPEIEVGSRPPVGRFAPRMLRRSGPSSGGGGSSSGGRGPAGGHGRSSGGSGGGGYDRGPRRSGGDRIDSRDAPRGGNGGGGGVSRDQDRDRARDNGGGRRREFDPEDSQRKTAAAEAEVDSALQALQEDPQLSEFLLRPANSYYRRIQHQLIGERGFASESIGEGNDRAVRISRPAQRV